MRLCPVSASRRESKRKAYSQREALLPKFRIRTRAKEFRIVSFNIKVIIRITVFNEFWIFTPGFSKIGAKSDPRMYPKLDSGPILKTKLKNSASLQGWRAAKIESSF